MSTSVSKIVAERNHRTLLELASKQGNEICADCKARAPRWASYNLGIFICVNCASIHRKIGTHITKVKSITLDEWSKEQVGVMKENGNIKSNALYNPNEARHPPPTNMTDSERDSELEKFIRSKYEFKRFADRKSGATSQPVVADLRMASTAPRPRSSPLMDAVQIGRKTSPGPPPPPKTPENLPARLKFHPPTTVPPLSRNALPTRSTSQLLPPLTTSDKLTAVSPLRRPAATQPSVEKPVGQVWEDLISLQEPSKSSSLPLQYSLMTPITSLPSQPQVPVQPQPTTPSNVPNPFLNLSYGQVNTTGSFVASPILVSTPGPQFPFAPSTPQSSPALHLGTTNPFNHTPLPSPSVASANSTAFSTNLNPFSSSPMPMSMAMSTSATPSTQPVMMLPTGTLLHTPLPYVPSQTPSPFIPATASLGQNPFAPIGAPGQIPLAINGATNPFSTMQMGGYSEVSPPTAFGTPAFLNQQQQQQQSGPIHGFDGWAEQGTQGTL